MPHSDDDKQLASQVAELESRLKRSEMVGRLALGLGTFAAGVIALRPSATAFLALAGWR